MGAVHGDAGRAPGEPCGCGDCLRMRRVAGEARRRAVLEERQRVAAAREATAERRRLSHRTRRADRKQGIGAADRVCLCRKCGRRIPYLGTGKPPSLCTPCVPPWRRHERELRWQRHTQEKA